HRRLYRAVLDEVPPRTPQNIRALLQAQRTRHVLPGDGLLHPQAVDLVGPIGAVGLPDRLSVAAQPLRQAPGPVSSHGTERAYVDSPTGDGHWQALVGPDGECLARRCPGHALPRHDRVLPGETVAVGVLSGADQGAHRLGYLTVDRRGPVFG